MLTRLTILILLLPLLLQAAPISVNTPLAVSNELSKIPTYQEAKKAMADKLPDVASHKFRAVLTDEKLTEQAIPYVTLALAEALIRSNTPAQATQALQLLDGENLTTLASTPIFKAEALASLGRYQEAETTLSAVPQEHPRFSEILLARARIFIALTRTQDALAILTKAASAKSTSSKTRNAANLLAAEIHIDEAHNELARDTLENIDSLNPSAAKLKEYLHAHLSLANGNTAEATNQFKSLITAPDHLSERIFHACILGLADAQAGNKKNNDAIATLEQYITDYPDAPTLQSAFNRLSTLLPENLPDDHPSMLKLSAWSSTPTLRQNTLYPTGETADAIPPHHPPTSQHDDLVTLSLYHRALMLARTNEEKNHTLAMALLALLRAQHPPHTLATTQLYLKLASASLLDTAYLHLKRNQPEQATFTLSILEKAAFSPDLKDQASFLKGLLLAKENNTETSLEAFNSARQSTSLDIANAATINAGITALKATNLTAFEKLLESPRDNHTYTSLLLERALWKCSQLQTSGRLELETFIIDHPEHPRENEARLALATASVNITPPDITLAKAQLDIISPRLPDPASQLSITRIRIQAEELAQNWPAAAAAAQKYILTSKDIANIPAIMLKLGEAHFHNEDYNKALRIFQEIPTKYPDSTLSPYASFYAAMSARLGGTTQARQESIDLFQTLIDKKHSLSSAARIQQSRVLIDFRRYTEAETSLKILLESKGTPPFIRRGAAILLADCHHRQGSSDSKKYQQAITIYNDLLNEKDLPLASRNQLHYLRGQTYESMLNVSAAFNSYYDVIVRANVPTEGQENKEEWRWFYRCGFKALTMLETNKRWEAAVKLARRIASYHGPRAEEAAKRANSIAKKHMIWEDEDPLE